MRVSLRVVTFVSLMVVLGGARATAQQAPAQLPSPEGPASETLARVAVPNDMTIELLGRCLLYSLSYQRMVSPQFGIEGGFSVLGGSGASVMFFSVGARLYLVEGNSAPYIAGGGVFGTASSDSGPFSSDASSTYGFLNPGFEYRSSGGFVFRGGLYFLIAEGGFFTWPGIQVGVAF